jgi:hypothetical protein
MGKRIESVVVTYSQFVAILSDYKAGGQFVNVVMNTEPEMNKGRGANRNPFLGRVRKISVANYRFNSDYERICRKRQVRNGEEPTFVADAISGRHWLVRNKVEQSNKDESTLYMRLYVAPNDGYKCIYLLDGRLATPNEVTEIRAWFPKKEYSKKQLLAGIPIEEQLEVRSPKFSSIYRVKMGHIKYIIIPDEE